MQRNVFEYLEQAARQWPQVAAFSDDRSSLSFGELLRQAQEIGSALLPAGVQSQPVAVLSRRDPQTIAGFMGALCAGRCYAPIDSAMPFPRMREILAQLRPAALLYGEKDQKLARSLAELCPILPISGGDGAQCQEAALREARERVLDVDPAYIIFTSGSTGRPKGIVVSHRSLIDFTDWYADMTGVDREDCLGNQAPFFFDLSVKDIYLTLKTGAPSYIIPKKCFSFPALLIEALDKRRVTTLSWSTSAFHMVANSGVFQQYRPEYLRRVLLGGEALQAKQLNIWRKALPEVQYVNLYGPTEVTVDCTYYPVARDFADGETIPIGRPCANMDVLLLDPDGHPVADGEPGEICVRGTGLALGYYGEWERTARAFIQNPLNPAYPDRLYRTGDIGRRDKDGNILFLTRKDGQIKHLGYRIELGEIETALHGVPQVQEGVCLFHEERDKLVCCYQGEAPPEELARELKVRLPKYMVPNIYHQLAEMPHTPNGKIDRVRLGKEFLC